MLSERNYLSLVKISAWYDLLIILPFSTPWTLDYLYLFLQQQHSYWQFQGQLHSLNASHYLFANLLASVVLIWAIARLLRPEALLGRLDALARVLFSFWQIYAWLHGVSSLILVFTYFEIAFGLAQALPLATHSRQTGAAGSDARLQSA